MSSLHLVHAKVLLGQKVAEDVGMTANNSERETVCAWLNYCIDD